MPGYLKKGLNESKYDSVQDEKLANAFGFRSPVSTKSSAEEVGLSFEKSSPVMMVTVFASDPITTKGQTSTRYLGIQVAINHLVGDVSVPYHVLKRLDEILSGKTTSENPRAVVNFDVLSAFRSHISKRVAQSSMVAKVTRTKTSSDIRSALSEKTLTGAWNDRPELRSNPFELRKVRWDQGLLSLEEQRAILRYVSDDNTLQTGSSSSAKAELPLKVLRPQNAAIGFLLSPPRFQEKRGFATLLNLRARTPPQCSASEQEDALTLFGANFILSSYFSPSSTTLNAFTLGAMNQVLAEAFLKDLHVEGSKELGVGFAIETALRPSTTATINNWSRMQWPWYGRETTLKAERDGGMSVKGIFGGEREGMEHCLQTFSHYNFFFSNPLRDLRKDPDMSAPVDVTDLFLMQARKDGTLMFRARNHV